MLDIREKAIELVGLTNTLKGEAFPVNHIEGYKEIPFRGGTVLYKFKVKSSNRNQFYSVDFIMKERKLLSATCTCPQYEIDGKCKHIAAVLYAEEPLLFEKEKMPNNLLLSQKILGDLTRSPRHTLTQNKVSIKLEIFFESSYYNSGIFVKLKVGTERIYVLGNKLDEFFRVFSLQKGEVYFGKQFTYDPRYHYFTSEDETLLNFLYECHRKNGRFYGGLVFVGENMIDDFLPFLKDRDYILGNKGVFHGVYFENPFSAKLLKKDTYYTFALKESAFQRIYQNSKYIVKDHKFYVLPAKAAALLDSMQRYKMNALTLTQKDLHAFVKNIFPDFEKETEVEKDIEKEVIFVKPDVQFYFDIEEGHVKCHISFDYNGEIISYFETASFLRDEETEEEMVRYILNYGFTLDKKSLTLKEEDKIGHFLEEDLFEISEKYTVFTSQKLKDTHIVKKTHITSGFSIGKDNIMRYQFDLEGIEPSEIRQILDKMKQNKKYYRLHNGDILDIENNKELTKFENLVDDMDLTGCEIESGEGVIPKYRAIYLDSLIKTKYKKIKTNNLFDALIGRFNAYKDASISLSEEDGKILRPYQLIGVKWLYTIYKCGFGGILADEMGLGKSIQLIYFIKEVLKEKKDAQFLIVAPTSLIYNWENEFQKFGKDISYKVIAENKEKRLATLRESTEVSVLITTYGLVRRDREVYEEIPFECIVIDEAQNIKNPVSETTKAIKELKGETRFALTGTPVENSVVELWSIFDFIMPGYLHTLHRFQGRYKKMEESTYKSLNDQIDAFILRRKKEDVAKDLPPKIENHIYLDLTLDQKKIYMMQLKKTEEEMDALIEKEGFLKSRFKILELLTRLRQICIDPHIVYEDYKGESSKIENVISIMKDTIENGHKILLFTSFRTALRIVAQRCKEEKISHYIIDGSVSSKKRASLVEDFNENDTNVFLIMLKAGGTGLNLTGADVVIHLDMWWNPQAENQATDRAHRIGQTNTVEVIKLICKGTIEERILELQNKKRELSDILIDGNVKDGNQLNALDEEEIRKLLSYEV